MGRAESRPLPRDESGRSFDPERALLGADAFPADRAGTKATTLHELTLAGFDVPPGFVVPDDVDPEGIDAQALAAAVRKIGGYPLAVRSSGTLEDLGDASFAGLYESYLGIADPETLRDRIRDARASARDPRVTAYLRERKLDSAAARVAVLVQRLVDARTSGVAFTLDPTRGIEDHAVAEFTEGLGDQVVSGRITPSRLVFRLSDGKPVEATRGQNGSALTDDEIRQLRALLLEVQARRGHPQDVEWAFDREGKLRLLQSRPVTAIRWRDDVDEFTSADFRDGGVAARVCTPLMFSLYRNAFQPSMQAYFEGLGLLARGADETWIRMFYGRPYWNASAVKRCLEKVPGFDERAFDADLGLQKDYGEEGPLRTPTTIRSVLRALPVAWRLGRGYRRHLAAVEAFCAAWPERYRRWTSRTSRIGEEGEAEFRRGLAEVLAELHPETEQTYFTTIYNNSNAQTDLRKLVEKMDAAAGGTTSVVDLMCGLSNVSHMELQRGICTLYRTLESHGPESGEWRDALQAFLDEHGFHADAELDLTEPRWAEVPERVEAMIGGMVRSGTPPSDPSVTEREQRARFSAELERVRVRLAARPRVRLRFGRRFAKALERMRAYLSARERMRQVSTQCYAIVRAWAVEAGRRFADEGRLDRAEDVFMLDADELVSLARGEPLPDLAERVAFRRAMYEGYRDLSPPPELGRALRPSDPAKTGDGSTVLTGLGCSPGVAEGTVRVIGSLAELGELRRGDVLVTRFTDPGWTPALGLVAGVVTEVGGMLSHAAVIGREYGIPAVLNLPGATKALASGQRVRIDGAAGTVEILAGPPDPAEEKAPVDPAEDQPARASSP